MRLSHVLLFTMLIALLCCVYNIANHYQAVERRVANLNSNSERENENIRVLQAEWAFLTNPVRMEKIARDYFQMEAMDGRQLVALASTPLRGTLDARDLEMNGGDVRVAETPAPALAAQPVQTVADAAHAPPEATQDRLPAAMPAALPAPMALPPVMAATPVSMEDGQ